jgi:hypothetical protein
MLPLVIALALAGAPLEEEAPEDVVEAPAVAEPAVAEPDVEPIVLDDVAAGREELRWLALSGATAIGLGLVGVTAAGVWFAFVDGRQAEAPAGQREVALVGVGVSTGLIALGAGLVLLDVVLGE